MLEEWRRPDCVFSPPKSVCLFSQTLHSQHCHWHHQYHHHQLSFSTKSSSSSSPTIIHHHLHHIRLMEVSIAMDQSFPTSLSKQNPIQGFHLSVPGSAISSPSESSPPLSSSWSAWLCFQLTCLLFAFPFRLSWPWRTNWNAVTSWFRRFLIQFLLFGLSSHTKPPLRWPEFKCKYKYK